VPPNESDAQSRPVTSTRIIPAADRLLAPVIVVARDSRLLYLNPAAAHAIGQEPDELIGRRMLELVHPEDRPRISRQLRKVTSGSPSRGSTTYRLRSDPAADWRIFESTADNLIDDPDFGGILVSSRDVTDQRAHERELYEAAYHDPLTGLPNRAKINEDLRELMDDETVLSVAFLGIDRFNLINDSLGHATGDAVLQAVSARVRASVPVSSVVGRFGGDLIIVLIVGPAAAEARSILWGTVGRVGEPLFIAGHELRLSCSAGIAGKDAAATADSILRDAGLALRRANAHGGGRVELFETDMRNSAIARLELEANLRRGLARSEFTLALQPVVRLSDASTPVHAEALVRWHLEDRVILPNEFIRVAEETGLIVPLGDWIIDRAAQLAVSAPGGRVMVNLSARQLASPGLPERIARVLATRRLPASSLGFEITETLLIEQFDFTVDVLRAIRQLGCRIGLDDFGTGYSSLSYLRRLPIDFLKIDGSFIADIDSDHQSNAIVGAIITMADALALEVVAEGVEREAQADSLRELGCGFAQGYLFGRPVEM
jgi:diguanylate cyclase (GGDEF)-like protein/PAS domain S-box-containing protein